MTQPLAVTGIGEQVLVAVSERCCDTRMRVIDAAGDVGEPELLALDALRVGLLPIADGAWLYVEAVDSGLVSWRHYDENLTVDESFATFDSLAGAAALSPDEVVVLDPLGVVARIGAQDRLNPSIIDIWEDGRPIGAGAVADIPGRDLLVAGVAANGFLNGSSVSGEGILGSAFVARVTVD